MSPTPTFTLGTTKVGPRRLVSRSAAVVISEVEEGGSAQQAGLQPGDALIELDGVCGGVVQD